MNDLKTTGHASVYGIFFDTGKSDLKPESEQAIGEIGKLKTHGIAGSRMRAFGNGPYAPVSTIMPS